MDGLMNSQTLTYLTNSLIVMCIAVDMFYLHQSLALLGLLLLKEFPPSVECQCESLEEEEEPSKPVGFVHNCD